jgi:hypothetical protein
MGGNAPLVVFRDHGEVRVAVTAHPVDRYLAALREEWKGRDA